MSNRKKRRSRPLEAAERETIILLNDADKKEGFFRFSTSKHNDRLRFLKRVGGLEKLVKFHYEYDDYGTPIWFEAFVSLKYLSSATFSIRKGKAPKEVIALVKRARKTGS